MRILVTNDDGILAPGILALADAMRELGEVIVIAPDRNNSGVSSSISLEVPLRVTEVRSGWYQLNGTPADCVKLALSGFLKEQPDIVVAGVNTGANLGDDVLYSGTVGGALEGRYLALPPVAVSCVGNEFDLHGGEIWHFETAAAVAKNLVKHLLKNQLPTGVALNVNVPNVPPEQLKGCIATRQGERHFSEPLIPRKDGRGKPIYWLGRAGAIKDDSQGTDFHAIHQGYASVTPMHVDLTAWKSLDVVKSWLESDDD